MRGLAFLALAGLALPLALAAQGIPDALKDKALVVSINAIVPAALAEPAWHEQSVKYTVPGTPVPFKLVGSNVAIIVQITPFEQEGGKGVTLIAQGQVWVRPAGGRLSYHTTIESLSVEYGETVLFFPLGLGPEGKAPIRLEITIIRASDIEPEGGGAGEKAGK